MIRNTGYALALAGVIIAGLPLLMSGSTMDPVLIPRFTMVGIMILVVAVISLFTKERSFAALNFLSSSKVLPFYLFLVSGFIGFYGAVNQAEAAFFVARDLMFFVFALMLIHLFAGHAHRILYFVRCLIVAALIISGFGIVQLFQVYLQTDGQEALYQVRSTMSHRNLMVSALVMLLPFSAYGIYRFKKLWRILATLVALLSTVLILGVQSRTGWLALMALLAIFLLIVLIANTGLKRMKVPLTTLGMAMVIFSLGGFLIFYTASPEVKPNAELRDGLGYVRQTEKTFTADERIFMWKATGRMINDQSILGVGPGNWKIWFPKYGSDIWRSRQGMVQFQRPHNDYLWILAEQGIIGLLAYIFMGIVVFYCGLRLILSGSISQDIKWLLTLVLSSIAAYYVVSLFSFPRERVMHQGVLYAGFAMILSIYFREPSRVRSGSSKRWVLVPILGLILMPFIVYIGSQRWLGEIQTRKMLAARAAMQWLVLLAEYEPVENLLFYNIDPTSVPVSFYSGLAWLNLKQNEKAESEFRKAYKVHPYNIHVVNNLANIYQLSGDPIRAITFYEKALEISPKYLDGALNLIAAYFNNNQVKEAYDLLRKYAPLFAEDGREDERYRQYLLVVMRTLRDNLCESRAGQDLKKQLRDLSDEQLITIHYNHLQAEVPIEKILLQKAYRNN